MIRVEIDINDDGGPAYNWPRGQQPVCPACDAPWELRGQDKNATVTYEWAGHMTLSCDCGYQREVVPS